MATGLLVLADISDAERAPFIEIARRKGSEIEFVEELPPDFREEGRQLHLDMDMVEASLRDAVARTQRAGRTAVSERLQRLLDNGTDAQKIEFVLGSGTYYFPEDLERHATLSRNAKAAGELHVFGQACENVCTTVCQCVVNPVLSQFCRPLCRWVCSLE